MKLLKYEHKGMVFFGDGEYENRYELTLLKSYLFGLYKKEVKKNYTVSMLSSLKEHEGHWDNLIKTKGRIR